MVESDDVNDLYDFEILSRDGHARIGRFRTRHGFLQTPVLLPVINPNTLTVPPKVMERELPVRGYITNGYIIHHKPELRENALENGVHGILETELPIMTDSGTFQMYVYGAFGDKKNRKKGPKPDPNEIVKFQSAIGSDIITILDMFTDPGVSREEAEVRVAETLTRAEAACDIKGGAALACTVQGGVYPDLRERAARELSELDCEVHPIGGVVPLMENYRYADVVKAVIAAKSGLTPERPVHLFGAGHPMMFPLAVLLGCDIFDSSSYAKYAQDDRLMYPDGTKHLSDLEESPCLCPVCSKYLMDDLKEMPDEERKVQLALHNLHVSFNELKAVRQAIVEGTLREMVERRAAAHPFMLEVLKVLGDNVKFMEAAEPLSRKRLLYTGPASSSRPEVYRFKKRFFERYRLPPLKLLILFEDKTGQKPYSAQFAEEIAQVRAVAPAAHFLAITYFGPAPIELEDTYPIAQSVVPRELDQNEQLRISKLMEHFAHKNRDVMGIIWDGQQTLEFVSSTGMGEGEAVVPNIDLLKVLATADMQFGRGAGEILMGMNDPEDKSKYDAALKASSFRKSKKTGRIRNVQHNHEHILSFRASDGYMSLKPAGAERLRAGLPPPSLRVIVNEDSAEFNRDGKSVFAKFVIEADENIRPGDEVLVVDEKNTLVAVGRALMTRDEMMAFNIGTAVKVREGIKADK